MKSAARVSRRSLLGLATLALAGCKRGSRHTGRVLDPDARALASARASEIELLGSTTNPLEHALHVEHLVALGGTVPSPLTTPVIRESDRSLLRSSAASLRTAAVAASSGAHAAVLASIAAAHEVMLHE